jgi:hypothetical protein
VDSILAAKFVSVLAAVFLLLTLGAVSGEAKPPCTTRSVEGNYAYLVTGTNVGDGPVAAVGLVTADGEGSLSASDTVSANGEIIRRTITGTYTVNANCTGTVTFTDNFGLTTHLDLVLAQGRQELILIQTDPGTVTPGVGRKQ